MKLVIIESPYAGDVERNLAYGRACLRDSLLRGEAPFASHLLYTQAGVLDDNKPDERALGMKAGFELYLSAELCAVYKDLGISGGMVKGMERAENSLVPIEYRSLGGEWS